MNFIIYIQYMCRYVICTNTYTCFSALSQSVVTIEAAVLHHRKLHHAAASSFRWGRSAVWGKEAMESERKPRKLPEMNSAKSKQHGGLCSSQIC